jgi:hypothetical protein
MPPPSPSDPDLALLIDLFEAAEELYPYLTGERLARLLRQDERWSPLRGRLGSTLRQAARAGLLLTDRRQRLDRQGLVRPVQLYRLNYRHPRLVALIGPAAE